MTQDCRYSKTISEWGFSLKIAGWFFFLFIQLNPRVYALQDDAKVAVTFAKQSLFSLDSQAFRAEKKKHYSREALAPVRSIEAQSAAAAQNYEGVLLSELVDRVTRQMDFQAAADVDLLVLKSKSGEEALLPRHLVTKYPIKVAHPFQIVIPWTSRPKILSEGLPLEKYVVKDLVEIELASFKKRFQEITLLRRTDPYAMRGEKTFLQNCLGCHGSGSSIRRVENGQGGPQALMDRLIPVGALFKHPTVMGLPHYRDPEIRALSTYKQAFLTQRKLLGKNSD